MRQSLKTCVFVVAASGVLGAGGGVAYADAGAGGGATNSPGVLSGNSIQVTVDAPVNACGNSVDGGAALNPATGASCGNGAAPGAVARRPLNAAPPPPVAQRPAPEQVRRHTAPEGTPHRERPTEAQPAKAAPKHARKSAEGPGAVPGPRSARDARAGAEARAGASGGSALLASTGPGEMGVVAGTGGGLLLGGALLLRRSRTRRR
ncbi:chaplin family protein [Streptomyces sp. DSM 41527]|uniref:Chaplin family protein n=1 Tax=Streptomyces mooreae TaxID=3075523 RepID=A0ABU2TFX0_9ACTN|nr:chaplin family protein [Streptomyces sp. DSM 41527]MDT0459775.1 chaplin family protein [Streptomyces sp. DSM 41527]